MTWSVIDSEVTTSQQRLCDFTATATGQIVYAAASRTSCAQAPTETRLWRSDDAGADWIDLGPFQGDIQDQELYPTGTLLTPPGAEESDLLYRNEALSTGDRGLYFRYSQDKGITWKSTPAIPVVPTAAPDQAQVQPAAALRDR